MVKLLETDRYKGHTIKVYKQKPNIKIPKTDKEWDKHFNRSDLDGVLGTHAYEVLNKDNEIEYSCNCDMWDILACIENASQDIDSLTWKGYSVDFGTITVGEDIKEKIEKDEKYAKKWICKMAKNGWLKIDTIIEE